MPNAEPVPPPAPTLRLRVDTSALKANWRALDDLSGDAAAGAAVKADCYGLGVGHCVPSLREAGCEHFFVAHWSEVADVARHVPADQIAVLHGIINANEIAYAKAIGAVPVINSVTQARNWIEAGGGRCHLMVDTGINRLGVTPDQLSDAAIQSLKVDVLMSHLACADENSAMNVRQLNAFKDATAHIAHQAASLANSAGIALGPDYRFDITRPGLALYGGVARPELAGKTQQVAYVEAAILQTRTLRSGDRVGYNGEFAAQHDMQVATVSMGYADGFLRMRGRDGFMMHGETQLPIIGKVSMDMIVLDITQAPQLTEGEWVQVPFFLKDAAQQSTLSQYELLTSLGNRLRH